MVNLSLRVDRDPTGSVVVEIRTRGGTVHRAPQTPSYQPGFTVTSDVPFELGSDDLQGAVVAVRVARELVALEARSTFSFQPGGWLGDVAPDLLDAPLWAGVAEAKERAAARQAAEAEIPPHLLYEAGWPVCMPTPAEARHLASVRRRVARAVGIAVDCLDGAAVSARYAELMRQRAQRGARASQFTC